MPKMDNDVIDIASTLRLIFLPVRCPPFPCYNAHVFTTLSISTRTSFFENIFPH